jgi:hypothetical protein
MVFRGIIILLEKDSYDCIHFLKKFSGPAELKQYKEYLQNFEKNKDIQLIQSYVIKKEKEIKGIHNLWLSNQ